MNDSIKFIVPGKPEYIGPVRVAISLIAGGAGFNVEEVEDIKMAVSEACSKAICPGTGGLGLYEVTCELGEKRLTVSVLDREGGCHFQVREDSCIECTKHEGLGIFMLKAFMDEVSVFEEPAVGSGIRMIKYVK